MDSVVRVGTAGWDYEDWNAVVYPARPPRGFDRLSLMASLFDVNEVNSTFYRIPPPRMTERWVRRVEHNPRFVFTAKLFRGFTHERQASDADREAFHSSIEPLAQAGRLGCVLIQFPMSFHATPENRDYLEGLLGKFQRFPLAAEFRHASWDEPGVRELLKLRSAAFVNIDQPRLSGTLPPTDYVTASVAYFRFHGRNAPRWFGPDTSNAERYNYLYSEKELEPWAERIRAAAQRIESSLPAGPEAKGGLYAILNNHFRGQAVANGLQLQAMLTGQIHEVPETLRATYGALTRVTRAPGLPSQRTLF